MISNTPYNSALSSMPYSAGNSLETVEAVWSDTSIAYVCDIEKDILKYYERCDIIYVEPPFPNGHNKFRERAGLEKTSYEALFKAIARIVDYFKNNNVPIIILNGKNAEKHLKQFNPNVYESKLLPHGGDVTVYLISGENDSKAQKVIESSNSSFDILTKLSKEYNRIGDFCCGVGNSGRIFHENGKTFTMSDIDPKCIGFIAENIARKD